MLLVTATLRVLGSAYEPGLAIAAGASQRRSDGQAASGRQRSGPLRKRAPCEASGRSVGL